jgi:thioredoxin reductase (NADPH)
METLGQVLNTDICVIGAGPVGIFTVFEAGINKLNCVVVDSLDFIGGQCTAMYPQKPIYDIPAHPFITAAGLIENLRLQADRFKPTYLLGKKAVKINGTSVVTSDGTTINAKAIVIAAGYGFFGPNKPPLANIEAYEGTSVFYMVGQTERFRNARVVIAGGGDSAVDWAINLAPIAKKTYLVHRRDKFKAAQDSLDQLKQLSDQGLVEFVVPYQLEGLAGDVVSKKLSGVVVKDMLGGVKTIEADFLLPFFGLTTDFGPLLQCGIDLENGHIKADPSTMQTSANGVFVAGDAASYKNKQKLILTGFAEAALAIKSARDFIFPGQAFHFQHSTSAF